MKKTYLLIPGNPAVASYYYSWMDEIKSANPDIDITYATSYVLYSKKLNYVEYDLAMRKHYEDMFLALDASNKVTIIAHSVGSYFALRLLEKYPDKIEKVILAFPYIGYSSIKSLNFLPILYWIDRVLPLVEIISRFKRFFTVFGQDVHNISSTELTACLRFGVRQCVYFNDNKFDICMVASQKDKIHLIYTEGDRWCPIETIELLKPISKFQKVNIPHDFIVRDEYRQEMAKLLKV